MNPKKRIKTTDGKLLDSEDYDEKTYITSIDFGIRRMALLQKAPGKSVSNELEAEEENVLDI